MLREPALGEGVERALDLRVARGVAAARVHRRLAVLRRAPEDRGRRALTLRPVRHHLREPRRAAAERDAAAQRHARGRVDAEVERQVIGVVRLGRDLVGEGACRVGQGLIEARIADRAGLGEERQPAEALARLLGAALVEGHPAELAVEVRARGRHRRRGAREPRAELGEVLLAAAAHEARGRRPGGLRDGAREIARLVRHLQQARRDLDEAAARIERRLRAVERLEADGERAHAARVLRALLERERGVDRGVERDQIGERLRVDRALEHLVEEELEAGLRHAVGELTGHARAACERADGLPRALPARDAEEIRRLGRGLERLRHGRRGDRRRRRDGRRRGLARGRRESDEPEHQRRRAAAHGRGLSTALADPRSSEKHPRVAAGNCAERRPAVDPKGRSP